MLTQPRTKKEHSHFLIMVMQM